MSFPNSALHYKRQEIKGASPAELIGHLYDFVIEACYKKDQQRVKELLSQLIKSLNFDYEISTDFFHLYEHCKDLARKENFDDIREIVSNLRDGWKAVIEEQREAKRQTRKLSFNA